MLICNCVRRLIKDGLFYPKLIKYRNVMAKKGDEDCVFDFFCDFLSSKISVVNSVYAVCLDKEDDQLNQDLSTCSCKKWSYFCSHLIGFLHLLVVIQWILSMQKGVEWIYWTNPVLVEIVLMPIQNMIVMVIFNQQTSLRSITRNKYHLNLLPIVSVQWYLKL